MKVIAGVIALAVLALASVGGWNVFQKAQVRKIPETNLFSLGQVAASQGDFQKAVEYYTVLLSKDPKHTIAWDFLINAQEKMGDIDGAIQSSEKLVALEPQRKYVERLIRFYKAKGKEDLAKGLEESLAKDAEREKAPEKK